jgi:hypothetical protein
VGLCHGYEVKLQGGKDGTTNLMFFIEGKNQYYLFHGITNTPLYKQTLPKFTSVFNSLKEN